MKKTLKSIIVLLLALSLMIPFVACDDAVTSNNETPGNTDNTESNENNSSNNDNNETEGGNVTTGGNETDKQDPKPTERSDSIGLEMKKTHDATGYYVAGIGTCTDEYIVIPAAYEGLPVVSIASTAFYNGGSHITGVIIPDSVIEIGENAFYTCHGLKEIVIGKGVTDIGKQAFSQCSALERIYFNATKVECVGDGAFGYSGNSYKVIVGAEVIEIPADLFSRSYELALLEFESGSVCEVIGDGSFKYCEKLKAVSLPETVKYIGEGAFKGCAALESINIPNSVKIIGEDAFEECSKLFTTEGGVTYIDKWVISCDTSVTNVVLRNDTMGIADWAFEDCIMTSIDIPATVTGIGAYAFVDCSALTTLDLPNSLVHLGDCAFLDCASLGSLTIPTGIDLIDSGTFSGCSSLKSVTLPDELTIIGSSAFKNCVELKDITLPHSLVEIGDNAFNGCTSLETIHIPDKVETIKAYAFKGCTSVKTITLGASLKALGKEVFYGCASLAEIYFNSIAMDDVAVGSNMFDKSSSAVSELTIIIGKEVTRLPAYFFTFIMDNVFYTKLVFEATSSCESIGTCAFSGLVFAYDFIIPASVSRIDANAFNSSLKYITVTLENPNGWNYSSNADHTDSTPEDPSMLSGNVVTRILTNIYYWFKE